MEIIELKSSHPTIIIKLCVASPLDFVTPLSFVFFIFLFFSGFEPWTITHASDNLDNCMILLWSSSKGKHSWHWCASITTNLLVRVMTNFLFFFFFFFHQLCDNLGDKQMCLSPAVWRNQGSQSPTQPLAGQTNRGITEAVWGLLQCCFS